MCGDLKNRWSIYERRPSDDVVSIVLRDDDQQFWVVAVDSIVEHGLRRIFIYNMVRY